MTTLRPLLIDTRDGEWGKGEPAEGRVEMRVIRGTDFGAVREGQVGAVPVRYLEHRHAVRKRLQPWDIVFETAGGSPDRPTGRSILLTPRTFELLGPNVTCASFARFLRVDPRIADPAFVFWMLQHHYERRELLQYHTQHTGVARFQFTTFSNTFEFDMPPLDTQHRIAAILSAYDDLIEVNRRRVVVLEEMARGLFEEWFVRFRFPGHESVPMVDTVDGPLPEGWAILPFTEVAEVLSGGTPKKDNPEFWDGDIPFFTPRDAPSKAWVSHTLANITDRGLAKCNSRLYEKDTVFITARGTVGKIGLAALPMAMNQSCYALIGRGYPQFFVFGHAQRATAHLQTMSTGAVFDTIIVDTFKRLSLPAPPRELAETYSGLSAPLFEQARVLMFANDRLAASRDLQLPRLISGQLSVEAAERELEQAA